MFARTTRIAATGLVLTLAACQPPMSDAQRAAVASDASAAMDTAMAALSRLDDGPYAAMLEGNQAYAENMVLYPTHDSLMAAVHAFPQMFRSMDLKWDGKPTITVLGPDAAVATGKFVQNVVDTSGAAFTINGIWTGVLQRSNGKWTIVQAHESYPVP